MAEPFEVTFGPFAGGLVTEREAHLLKPDEATVANYVDVTSGAILGIKDDAGLTNTANKNGAFWYDDGATLRALENDVAEPIPVDGTNRYFIRPASYGATAGARVMNAGVERSMGLKAPTTHLAVSLQGNNPDAEVAILPKGVKFLVTYVSGGLESNPKDLSAPAITYDPVAGLNREVTKLSSIPLAPAGSPVVTSCNIWRTDGTSDIFYFAFSIFGNATTTVYLTKDRWGTVAPAVGVNYGTGGNQTAYTLDTARSLGWVAGGYPGVTSDGDRAISTQYTQDHSPPPSAVTNFARAMHVASKSGSAGGGLAFAWAGKTLYWCETGFSEYWPTVNTYTYPDDVQMVVPAPGYVLVFTPSGTHMVAGYDSADLDFSQTASGHHIRKGQGMSAVWTPHGVIYLAHEGLAIHDGRESNVFSRGKIAKTYWGTKTWKAEFHGDIYRMIVHAPSDAITLHTALVADLRAGLAEARFRVETHRNWVWVGNGPQGYGMHGHDGTFDAVSRPLVLIEGGTTRQAWAWRTGQIAIGGRVSLRRLRLDYEGTITLTFLGGETGVATISRSVTTRTQETIWMPLTTTGKPFRGINPAIDIAGASFGGVQGKLYALALLGQLDRIEGREAS